jgi:hypothetical protein
MQQCSTSVLVKPEWSDELRFPGDELQVTLKPNAVRWISTQTQLRSSEANSPALVAFLTVTASAPF